MTPSISDILAQQRNQAMDALATAIQEREELRAQLEAVKAELAALKPAEKPGKKPA